MLFSELVKRFKNYVKLEKERISKMEAEWSSNMPKNHLKHLKIYTNKELREKEELAYNKGFKEAMLKYRKD
jgi:hypothetical protein